MKVQLRESVNTEFKQEYTEGIKKTIVAFANTSGGTLYIGIADDGSVVGVDNADDTMLKVANMVQSAIKPDISLFVQYETETLENAAVVKVTVQKGTSAPYYLAGKGIRPEGVYVRQGAASIPASEQAILKMLRENGGETYEEIPSRSQELTFKEASRFFREKGVSFGVNQQKSLHLQTIDGVYTNLGLLFSDQAVHTIKLAVFEGIEKEIFRDRREFSGSLLGQLNDAYAFLDMYNHTHAEVKGLYREDRRDYPEDSLREALLNALVHRDYAISASILISIFDNRIEFVSVGGLPSGISLEDLPLGVSVPRNKKLADVFYRLKLIEAYGTGIPRILRSYEDCPQKPFLQATGNAFKITLPNRNMPDLYNKPETAVRPAQPLARQMPPVYKNMFVGEKTPLYDGYHFVHNPAPVSFLTENEEKAAALFQSKPVVVRKDVEALLGVSQPMAVRVLRGLLDKGVIRSVGQGKNIRYVPA